MVMIIFWNITVKNGCKINLELQLITFASIAYKSRSTLVTSLVQKCFSTILDLLLDRTKDLCPRFWDSKKPKNNHLDPREKREIRGKSHVSFYRSLSILLLLFSVGQFFTCTISWSFIPFWPRPTQNNFNLNRFSRDISWNFMILVTWH